VRKEDRKKKRGCWSYGEKSGKGGGGFLKKGRKLKEKTNGQVISVVLATNQGWENRVKKGVGEGGDETVCDCGRWGLGKGHI